MKISKITEMPEQIPSYCTEKFNVRIEPWRKELLCSLSKRKNKSMSKIFLEMMDTYLNHLDNKFWKDVSEFSSPIPQKPSKRTKSGGVSGFFEKLLSCS